MKLKIAAAIAIAVTMSGCVPVFGRYYYIALMDAPGLEVTGYGVSKFETLFQERMPMSYRLRRQHYEVELEVSAEASAWPRMFVKSQSPDGTPLPIEPVDIGECSSWWIRMPGSRVPSYFTWYRESVVDCSFDRLRTDDEHVTRFKVVDEAGNIFGVESLPFALRRNGFWMEYDSI